MLVIWWLVLPEIGRVDRRSPSGERRRAGRPSGSCSIAAVIVLAVRVRTAVHRPPGAGQPRAGRCRLPRRRSGHPASAAPRSSVAFGNAADFGDAGGVRAATRCSARSAGSSDGCRRCTAPLWVRCVDRPGRRAVVVLAAAYLLFRPPKDTRTPRRSRRGAGPHPAARLRRPRLARLLRHPSRQVGRLGHRRPGDRAGRGVLPGDRLGQPGQRQPGRRPGALGRPRSSAGASRRAPTAGRWR